MKVGGVIVRVCVYGEGVETGGPIVYVYRVKRRSYCICLQSEAQVLLYMFTE